MVSTNDEGPRCRQRGPSTTDPNSTFHALQDIDSRIQSTAQGRRIAALRGCGAAYHHLKARGLVSEVVVAELQRCLRDAA